MATATVLPPTSNEHFLGWVPRTKSTAVTRIPVPVRSARAYTDFSDAFLSANLLGSPSRKRTLTTSIILHTILIGIPLLLSAWFTDTLDLRTYTQTLLVAPPPAAAAPTPPPMVAAAPRQVHRVFTSQGKLFMPTAIPRKVAMLKEEPLPPEPEGVGVFGGVPGGVAGGVIGGILEGLKAPEALPLPPSRASVDRTRAPIPVGGDVRPPRIIYSVNPEYPLLAHQAGIQGEVIITAIIDSHGNVLDMKVVSGPPLLYSAAMKALGQWKFEPTYLNGEPVAIKWNASVKFRIGAANPAS
ncbi:MAG TPA: energy transducer TonB [Acidobacteriota bacterium]|nr:energy transducer TonB [Acidobacteriota bacterium]